MTRLLRQSAVLVFLLLALLLVAPAASPVRIGYVDSDSMAPTIEQGDGYVAVPAGEVETGDVVVYWSSARGEYVTHRVVGEAEGGFLTKGDNNDRTDQAAGYPPVPRTAILASVLTVGGSPVVLPGVGTLVPLVQTYRLVALVALLLAGAALLVRERARRGRRRPGRSVLRVGDVMSPLFLVAVVTFVAVTPLGAASYQLTYVASPDETGQYTIPVSESVTRTVTVDTPGRPLATHVVRAEGATIDAREARGGQTDLTVTIPPPGSVGPTVIAVHVYPYPAVLPQGVIETLHDVHPVVAVAGSILALFGPLFLLYRLLLDPRRPIAASRSRAARWLGGE